MRVSIRLSTTPPRLADGPRPNLPLLRAESVSRLVSERRARAPASTPGGGGRSKSQSSIGRRPGTGRDGARRHLAHRDTLEHDVGYRGVVVEVARRLGRGADDSGDPDESASRHDVQALLSWLGTRWYTLARDWQGVASFALAEEESTMTESVSSACVFLSHASTDHSRATSIGRRLRRRGLRVFQAPESIQGGQRWEERLRTAVSTSDAMLVCWSAAAARSAWVWAEIGMALALGCPVVAIRRRKSVPMLGPLKSVQAIDGLELLDAWAGSLASSVKPEFPAEISDHPLLRKCWENLYHFSPTGFVRAVRLYGSGDTMVPLDRVKITYSHEHYRPDLSAFPWFHQEVQHRVRTTKAKFFNGPNTRLLSLRASPAPTDAAREADTLHLSLGPVGWFDYAGVSEYIRDRRKEFDDRQIEDWIGIETLLTKMDVRDSRLPNILDTCTALITQDGQVAYQRRNATVSARPLWLTSAVAENINRLLDDASPADPRRLMRPALRPRDPRLRENRYKPRRVPHPFAAVRRGIAEELGPAILDAIDAGPFPHIKLTGISFDLDSLQPDALFIACIAMTADELRGLVRGEQGGRGKDWDEGRILTMPARFSDPETARVLSSREFVPAGHAATVRAIELLAAIRSARRCSHSAAMAWIGGRP